MALTKVTPSTTSYFTKDSGLSPDFPSNIYIANTSGDANNTFRIDGSSDGLYIIAKSDAGAAAGAFIRFKTSEAAGGETDRMTIAASGNVLIATTTDDGAHKLQVSGRTKSTTYADTRANPSISSNTLTLDLSTANVFDVSLNANITTLTISNPPASGTSFTFVLQLTADGTARSVTWGASVKWPGGTAPTLTSTNGKVDTFVFMTDDGGTNWFAFTAGQNA